MEANVSRRQNWPPLSAFPKRHCIATSPSKTRMFDSLIEFIEDSLITRINLILKDEKRHHSAPASDSVAASRFW